MISDYSPSCIGVCFKRQNNVVCKLLEIIILFFESISLGSWTNVRICQFPLKLMWKILLKSKQQQLELKQRDELEAISRSGRGWVYIKKKLHNKLLSVFGG